MHYSTTDPCLKCRYFGLFYTWILTHNQFMYLYSASCNSRSAQFCKTKCPPFCFSYSARNFGNSTWILSLHLNICEFRPLFYWNMDCFLSNPWCGGITKCYFTWEKRHFLYRLPLQSCSFRVVDSLCSRRQNHCITARARTIVWFYNRIAGQG